MTFSINLHAGGQLQHRAKQQTRWGDTPDILQAAKFAGQEMLAITDDAGAFDLTYLGFEAKGFVTMDAAKAAAPEFARKVLARLASLISD